MWVKSQGITPGHNELLPAETFTSVGVCAPQGRIPGFVRCGKRNQIIGLKKDKGPEELTHINNLTTSLLGSSSLGGCPHPLSLGVDLCFASISTKQIVSLCALPHVVVLCLIINFVPAFTVSASIINAFFTRCKGLGKNSF